MKKSITSVILGYVGPALSLCLCAGAASAQGTWLSTLEARDLDGNPVTIEAYYDTALDITWLANPALINTEQFGLPVDTDLGTYTADNPDMGIGDYCTLQNNCDLDASPSQGRIDSNWNFDANWAGAMIWIKAMNTANYLGQDGWRLPDVSPINGTTWNTSDTNNGTSDEGWAKTGVGWVDGSGNPVSELGHMYYVTLGNLGECTPNDSDPTSCVVQAGFGLTNKAVFNNLEPDKYWTSAQLGTDYFAAMRFRFNNGNQNRSDKDGDPTAIYAGVWPVHDGDIGTAIVESSWEIFMPPILHGAKQK